MTWMSRGRSAFRVCIPIVFALNGVRGPVLGASPATAPAPGALTAKADTEARILDPAQGRPVILRAKEEFRLRLRLAPGLEGKTYISLQHARAPSLRIPLTIAGEMSIKDGQHAAMTLRLPEQLPSGLYDLVVKTDRQTLSSPRCVKVVDAFKTRFRFVHLSDMTIDDPSAPAFDDRLREEVNLLAPEFIVATGDYTAFGRALDDASTWKRALDYFAGFDAPVYMACGDLDHEKSFTRYVAESPGGTFDYGPYHGIVLLDHAHHPMDTDQIAFVRSDLDAHLDTTFNILVTHNDDPGVLGLLAPAADLAEYLRTRKVRMLITGGSDDWDRTEYASRLDGLDIIYVRTHQSSTATRGRASGVSHYRVIEVDGDQVRHVYTEDAEATGIESSIAVGRLRILPEPPVPGRAGVTIQNGLSQRFEDARVWLRIARNGDARPGAAGGRILQAMDAGSEWLLELSVDLPDKGGVRLVASCGGDLPAPIPLDVELEGPRDLVFNTRYSPDGLAYFTSEVNLAIVLRNRGQTGLRTYPTVRLNGSPLPLTAGGSEAWPVSVPASGQVRLEARLRLPQFSPGEHLVQVIFLEDPVRRVTGFPVNLQLE